jgi:hypothetical protein
LRLRISSDRTIISSKEEAMLSIWEREPTPVILKRDR